MQSPPDERSEQQGAQCDRPEFEHELPVPHGLLPHRLPRFFVEGEDAWQPACRAVGLEGARPYDLRHSFVSLLIHEGRSVVEVARQAGHSPTMTLDVYAHVFDEFDIAERVSAEDQIAQARSDVSGSCPPRSDDAEEPYEIPANPYSPISLPRISFITSSVPPPIGPRRASRTARSMPYSRM